MKQNRDEEGRIDLGQEREKTKCQFIQTDTHAERVIRIQSECECETISLEGQNFFVSDEYQRITHITG